MELENMMIMNLFVILILSEKFYEIKFNIKINNLLSESFLISFSMIHI